MHVLLFRSKLSNNFFTNYYHVKPIAHFPNQRLLLTLFPDERQTPREDVHEVWQPVGVGAAVELADVHHVVLVLQNGSLGKR